MSQYRFVCFREATELPLLNIRGMKQPNPPPDSSNMKPQSRRDVSDISRPKWFQIESSHPPLNIRGVGAFAPHPPPDRGSHTKPERRRVTSGISVDCGNITVSQQSKHLPPLNQRGVGVLRPHPPDRSSVRDPDGRKTIHKVLEEWNITGSQRAAHLPPLNQKGVQHPDLHKRCKVPAIRKNITGPQKSEDLSPLNARDVGIHPSDVAPQIKPEGHNVLPATTRKEECGNIKRSRKLPPIDLRGLRPKPPQKKIQLWKPDDETFAFVCKRMKEDMWMDRAYQNCLSVEYRETFSSKCKKLREMDEMMDIIWRKS